MTDSMSFDDLVLVASLGRAPKTGLTEAVLSTRLRSLAPPHPEPVLIESLTHSRRRLEAEGLVERPDARSWKLSAKGCERACGFLRVKGLEVAVDWQRLKKTHVCARALDYPADVDRASRLRLADVDLLRTEVIRAHFELTLERAPTLGALRDALGWALLPRGVPRELVEGAARLGTFGSKVLVTDVLMYAAAGRSPVVRGRGPVVLAAALAGASGEGADDLYRAVLRRLWPASMPSPRALPFSDLVLSAARASKEGWFDDERVFISHVWRRLRGQGIELPIDVLKTRLLGEQQAGRLLLGRAELPHLMNEADLRESRIEDRNVAYVFIKVPAEPRR